jgi:hypothetical protein
VVTSAKSMHVWTKSSKVISDEEEIGHKVVRRRSTCWPLALSTTRLLSRSHFVPTKSLRT